MSRLTSLACVVVLALGFASACGGGGSSADASLPDGSRSDASAIADAPRPDAPLPDARPISRACPADPTVIPEGTLALTLSGSVIDISEDPVAAATIDVFAAGTTDVPLGTGLSGVDGTYSVTVPVTAGSPALLAYVRIRHAELVTNFIFPPDPIADDLTFDPIMFDESSLDLLYGVLAGTDRRADRSTMATLLIDCAFQPIDGATLTLLPAAEDILYLDTSGGLPSPETDGNTSSNGLGLAINVPLGTIAVGGGYLGEALETHDVGSFVDGEAPAMTTTLVHPVPAAP